MPLASRATQARANRAGAGPAPTADTAPGAGANVQQDIQPRRGTTSAPQTPKAPDTDTDTDTTAGAAQNVAQAPVEAAAPRARRTRQSAAPQATLDSTSRTTDTKALRARQREIEKEFKQLSAREQQALRELAADFKAQRAALEAEHRLIAGQLSSAIFKG